MSEININSDSKDIEDNKTIAAIGYVWILCLLPLLLKRKSKFAQFHAKQGLVLFIVEILGWVIPLIGWIAILIACVFALVGIIQALDGKYWKMPFVYKYVEKLNL